MTTFVLIAIALTLAVIALVAYPLVFRKDAAPAAGMAALAFASSVRGGAGLLYPVWSKWNWNAPAVAADSPAAMVGRLARKMEKEPDNLEGWLMLGRSYAVIEQYPAVRARLPARQPAGQWQERGRVDRTGRGAGALRAERPGWPGRAALRGCAGAGSRFHQGPVLQRDRGAGARRESTGARAVRETAQRQSAAGGATHHRGAGAPDGWCAADGRCTDSTGRQRTCHHGQHAERSGCCCRHSCGCSGAIAHHHCWQGGRQGTAWGAAVRAGADTRATWSAAGGKTPGGKISAGTRAAAVPTP